MTTKTAALPPLTADELAVIGTDGKTYTPPARPTTFICWSCESACPNEQANDGGNVGMEASE